MLQRRSRRPLFSYRVAFCRDAVMSKTSSTRNAHLGTIGSMTAARVAGTASVHTVWALQHRQTGPGHPWWLTDASRRNSRPEEPEARPPVFGRRPLLACRRRVQTNAPATLAASGTDSLSGAPVVAIVSATTGRRRETPPDRSGLCRLPARGQP